MQGIAQVDEHVDCRRVHEVRPIHEIHSLLQNLLDSSIEASRKQAGLICCGQSLCMSYSIMLFQIATFLLL